MSITQECIEQAEAICQQAFKERYGLDPAKGKTKLAVTELTLIAHYRDQFKLWTELSSAPPGDNPDIRVAVFCLANDHRLLVGRKLRELLEVDLFPEGHDDAQ